MKKENPKNVTNNFTYVIPFKFTEDRYKTLTKVLTNIKFLNIPIVIVEQGEQSILSQTNLMNECDEYIFVENKLPFNKSWGLNCAWKTVNTEFIIFGDADNLIDPNVLQSSMKEMVDYDFISPHIRLIDLTNEESVMDTSEIFKIKRPGRGELDHQKLPLCGAMTIFRKSALEDIGGWPEEFFGWGAEDDAMSVKVKHFLKWKENDFDCYHLYHERVIPQQDLYFRNFKIYENYIQAPKEYLQQYIDSTKPFIGDKNRKFQ